MLVVCDDVAVLNDKYIRQCFFDCNCYMVDKSSLIIKVYDGWEKGGTLYTIRYEKSSTRKYTSFVYKRGWRETLSILKFKKKGKPSEQHHIVPSLDDKKMTQTLKRIYGNVDSFLTAVL